MALNEGEGEKDSRDVFSVQLKALTLVSMWPTFTGNSSRNLLIKITYWGNAVVLFVCTVALFTKAIVTDDLVDRSEAIDIFTLTGSALYKMVFFYIHHEELLDMYEWGLQLVPRLPNKWAQYAKYFTITHCTAGCVCITFWGVCPLIKWCFGETSLNEMTLPMNVYDPFASEGLLFSFFYAICHYGLLLSTHIYMAADCFLFTSIHVANGSLEMVHEVLEDMVNNKKNDDYRGKDVVHEKLKESIKLHTHTLIFIRKTDKLFRSMILADVLHAIISLSFAMLQASESKGLFEIVKMIVFVTYCFVHQYLNSYFGQHLIDQQERVYKQLLLVPWAEGSPIMKKSYLITIIGFRQVVKLSAWSAYNLQFATFLEFVKSMISYFMVLRQLNDSQEA